MCKAFMKNAVGSGAPSTPSDTDNTTHKNSQIATVKESTKPMRRRVRFQDAAPETIETLKPSSAMTDEERSQLFWQLSDYDYFRGTARIIASEVLKLSSTQPRCSHNYDSVLTRVYQVCSSNNTNSYNNSQGQQERTEEFQNFEEKLETQDFFHCNGDDNDDDFVLPPNLFSALTHWTKAGHSRRGLEKFCVPHHMQVRPLARQAVIQGVLIAQDLLADRRREARKGDVDNGKFVLGCWEISLDLPDEEILRMVSTHLGSTTSRRFATAMGHADAAAVGNYEYSKI